MDLDTDKNPWIPPLRNDPNHLADFLTAYVQSLNPRIGPPFPNPFHALGKGGCHKWLGQTTFEGLAKTQGDHIVYDTRRPAYGFVQTGGKRFFVHRLIFAAYCNLPYARLQLRNQCGDTLCLNPWHWGFRLKSTAYERATNEILEEIRTPGFIFDRRDAEHREMADCGISYLSLSQEVEGYIEDLSEPVTLEKLLREWNINPQLTVTEQMVMQVLPDVFRSNPGFEALVKMPVGWKSPLEDQYDTVS